ncbi:UrcA family protein [Sphingomonas adhaesiva]|uniref:UrcA family protein n=1 Tax=Sphingomonas adhaesiva TaxID=28212 RepID=UPI002FFD5067
MKVGFMAMAALGLACAGAANAAGSENPLAKDAAVLQLKGLDLATADGQQRLAIRMDAAAQAVCGDERLASVHLALADKARNCRAQVIADIRQQIESRQASLGPAAQLAATR